MKSKSIYKALSSCGFFLQALWFSKRFWFKNTVQWNQKGIAIRINALNGKSLRFDDIRKVTLEDKKMTLTLFNAQKIELDLTNISSEDTQNLYRILLQNVVLDK